MVDLNTVCCFYGKIETLQWKTWFRIVEIVAYIFEITNVLKVGGFHLFVSIQPADKSVFINVILNSNACKWLISDWLLLNKITPCKICYLKRYTILHKFKKAKCLQHLPNCACFSRTKKKCHGRFVNLPFCDY